MDDRDAFSTSAYAGQTLVAESELFAFIHTVSEMFGPGQARVSEEDWLEESELMDAAPRSTPRDWRSVTIAASARLAYRIDAEDFCQRPPAA